MTSPAEAYRDRMIAEEQARTQNRLETQQAKLREIQMTVGFGDPVRGDSFMERQISFHLGAASELIAAELRGRRPPA